LLFAQGHGAENTFQARERMIGSGGTTLEDVLAVFAKDDDRVAAVSRFPSLSEVALEVRQRGFHANQII